MTSWPGSIDAITLFVEDLEAAKRFYREVFGLSVFFEGDDSAVFKFRHTLVNLLAETSAAELIDPAPVALASRVRGSSSLSRWMTWMPHARS